MSGVGDPGVNAAHRTGGSPARPVHGAFQHSMVRRCFNHDYCDPFFYMVTITTHQRRPWFGVCENSACTLSADGLLIRDLWHRIPRDYPQIALSTLCLMPDHLHGIIHVTERMEKPVGVPLRAFKSNAPAPCATATTTTPSSSGTPATTTASSGAAARCAPIRATSWTTRAATV